jgi:calcium-dependent protein kinase
MFEKGNLNVKIIDFGVSTKISSHKFLTQNIGTPNYKAPEVILQKYNEKCDLWSLGIILFTMLFRRNPF